MSPAPCKLSKLSANCRIAPASRHLSIPLPWGLNLFGEKQNLDRETRRPFTVLTLLPHQHHIQHNSFLVIQPQWSSMTAPDPISHCIFSSLSVNRHWPADAACLIFHSGPLRGLAVREASPFVCVPFSSAANTLQCRIGIISRRIYGPKWKAYVSEIVRYTLPIVPYLQDMIAFPF